MNTFKSNSSHKNFGPAGWLARRLLASDVPVILLAITLVVVLVALGGCTPLAPLAAGPTQSPATGVPASSPTPAPLTTPLATLSPFKETIQPDGPVMPLDEFDVLVSNLRAGGAQVDLGEPVTVPSFSVAGRSLKVNGLSVTVFMYASLLARQADSDRISQDGFSTGSNRVDAPNLWVKGRLIVLYVGQDPVLIAQLNHLLGDPVTQAPPSDGMVTLDKAPFALAARKALSQKLGLPEDQITFVSAESVEWSNGCLGLAGRGEMCAMVVIPGYRVLFSAGGRTYEVHTDESGSSVRIK